LTRPAAAWQGRWWLPLARSRWLGVICKHPEPDEPQSESFRRGARDAYTPQPASV